jgi:hypothetical protein
MDVRLGDLDRGGAEGSRESCRSPSRLLTFIAYSRCSRSSENTASISAEFPDFASLLRGLS